MPLNVRDLRPDDRFVWCDRPVTVFGYRLAPAKRNGRWLDVREDGGTIHRLHYYDDERVAHSMTECAICGAEFATKTELDEHLQVCGIEILEVPEERT